MTTIYTRLAPLGFAEWLQIHYTGLLDAKEQLWMTDQEAIDSFNRTVFNALAFRWLREEKKINISINLFKDHAADNNDPYEYRYLIFKGRYTYYKDNTTHELAEHEALNKALEIISKGGDDVKNDLEVGRIYDVVSRRKGKFRMQLTYQDDTWATGIITKGRAKAICAYNEVDKGEEVTVRKELTTFTLIP